MSYTRTLGATASASLSVNAGGSASSSGGRSSSGGGSGGSWFDRLQAAIRNAASGSRPCITPVERTEAQAICLTTHQAQYCDKAKRTLCPPPPKAADIPEGQAFVVAPRSTVPRTLTGQTTGANAGMYTGKLPVPPATAVPTTAPIEESHGMPIWVWLAGGAAVLGTGAYLYHRRKAA
jgi:hypothetical protein